MGEPISSFALESYAAESINYFERLIDADGLPYFNVFWTEPAEAAHDWPDFGDVMSRQLQGVIMLRRMAGKETATEKVWQRKILSLIDPSDGQLHRRGLLRKQRPGAIVSTPAHVAEHSAIRNRTSSGRWNSGLVENTVIFRLGHRTSMCTRTRETAPVTCHR